MPTFAPEFLHPFLVHFPIVLIIGLAVADNAAVLSGSNLGTRTCQSSSAALIAVLAGIFAVFAFVSGTAAYDAAVAKGASPQLMDMHRDIAIAAAGLALIWAAFRSWLWTRQRPLAHIWNILVAAVSLGLAILVVITALYGMDLVFHHGINVTAMAG